MAVPILRLNIDDNPRIIVKPDQTTFVYTGYTVTTLIGSGDTTVTNISGATWIIYSEAPSGNTWGSITGDINNQTDLINYISGQTSGLTSSWSGLTGLPSDNSDLVDYVALEISGATSGLTSSWNEITDKPSWLSGTTLEAFQTGHTHSYDDLTDLPSLFSGDYDDLTNKPDLSVYQPVSGMSVYLTGVTWNDVTDKPDLTLQSDFTGHTSDMSIHYPMSGISITESQISDLGDYALQADFTGYTATTNTTITGIENDILYLSGITSGQTADISYISGVTDTNYQELTGLTSAINTYTGTTAPNTFVNVAGDTMTGALSMPSNSRIYGNSGTTRLFYFDTNSLHRWAFLVNAGAETGSNAGSDFRIMSFEDDGTSLAYPITISRATGVVDLAKGMALSGTSVTVSAEHLNATLTGVTCAMISGCTTGLTADIQYLSGITSGNTANIQWLSGYTSGMTTTLSGCTDVTITTPADNDILKYSGSTWVNEATLDLFANVDDLEYLRRNGTSITGVTTIDILANVDDGQLLARNGTDITGVTNSFAEESDLTGLTASFNSHTGDTTIHFVMGDITGFTTTSDFTGHTGNTAIHFEMSDITGFTTTTNFNTFTGTTAPQTYAPLLASIVSYTASTTGTSAWSGKIVEVNSTGATTITLPSGMTTGMRVDIVNVNTGDVTIASQGTLQGVGTILATQYTKAEAYHRGNDVWLITGTLTS